ncbi:ParB/RepB/Spo0J family partition protein [Mucisphaera sp.]|uniref:ParB/RepB/Spo0J family partition protein n=1 Tax=Mucisphaera sp. TaxID=2913024 RepID=UPI003D14A9C9
MPAKRPTRLGKGLASLVSQPVKIDPAPAEPPKPATQAPANASRTASESDLPAEVTDPKAISDNGAAGAKGGTAAGGLEGDGGLRVQNLSITSIEPNPYQPRQHFDEARLNELATSIRNQGVMQPILVRNHPDAAGRFQLIAGERRWRAAQLAELQNIPAIVQTLEDQQAAEWALIENLQREDLNPIERATALQQLITQHHISHDELGQRIGLDRSTVSNLLRLLQLAESVQGLVRTGSLAMGHARAVAGIEDQTLQTSLAERAVRENWSVRRVETEARKVGNSVQSAPAVKAPARHAHLAAMEDHITTHTGLKASLKTQGGKGAGTLTLAFNSLEDFDNLITRLGIPDLD